MVLLVLAELLKGIPLLRADVSLVALQKGQEALVPEHGHLFLLRTETEEVEDQGVYHAIGEGILLVLGMEKIMALDA